ncbi:hypothetical protein [Amycolatopsis sp. NBC_00438]|uniref:hypothetical protein n=1 Tax=Amycolatopsis sp. NBC_00438 TaxID=2903558 RepID=UPI002E1EB6E4
MAICFLLDIDFDFGTDSAEAARRLIRAGPRLRAGALRMMVGTGSRVNAVPRGVGYGVPAEFAERTRRLDLTAEERIRRRPPEAARCEGFEPFAPGYQWLPCRGETAT